MTAIAIEDLRARIGEIIGSSDWMTIDQATIDTFADATQDHQFIHVDPEKARATPFGGTIAHGFLTLSLLPAMLERSAVPKIAGIGMAVNYGLEKVRFLCPVPSGARVRAHFRLVALDEKTPGRFQQTLEATVEIESEDKPALVAGWIVQLLA